VIHRLDQIELTPKQLAQALQTYLNDHVMKEKISVRDVVPVPVNREHAKAMLAVAQAYLSDRDNTLTSGFQQPKHGCRWCDWEAWVTNADRTVSACERCNPNNILGLDLDQVQAKQWPDAAEASDGEARRLQKLEDLPAPEACTLCDGTSLRRDTAVDPLNYSINDAATLLGISRPTIYRLHRQGVLTIHKFGSKSLITSKDIDACQRRMTDGKLPRKVRRGGQ